MTGGRGPRGALAEIASELREVGDLDPSAIRARVVDAVHRITRGRHAAFLSIREIDGAMGVASLSVTDSLFSHMQRWNSAACTYPNLAFDPRHPPPPSKQRFEHGAMIDRFDEIRRSEYFYDILGSIDMSDVQRAYVYHGERYIGWLGALQESGEEPFTRAGASHLDGVLAAARAALVVADRAEQDLLPAGGADLVVRPDGGVEYASTGARRCLELNGFPDELRRAIRTLDRSEEARAPLLRCAHAVYTRLDGTGNHRYLVHLAIPPSITTHPTASLTPAQRAVADCLAVGATIDETARDLGLSRETVRTHLKAIYHKLGIASRAELARLWAES